MIKTEFIPLTIIDNFFEDPNAVRQKALSYEYGIKGNHPGYRTDIIKSIDPNLYSSIANKIFSLFVDIRYFQVNYDFGIGFQWTPSVWGKGWVHTDEGVYLAGVVYLTPNPPPDSGTLIYEDVNNVGNLPHPLKDEAYINRKNNESKLHMSEIYKKTREEHNNNYKKSITIENVYNRAVIYPANYFHAENNFFGKDIEDSRLVLIFFLHNLASNATFPMDRFNQHKI